ncbi:MAG: hypothetical protein IJK04_05885 [Kiritimatiellae bacterium]|nr:hypothetical protein [Kiritimatiellia bacterium]
MSVQIVVTVKEGTDRSLSVSNAVIPGEDATKGEKDVALAMYGVIGSAIRMAAKNVEKKEGAKE